MYHTHHALLDINDIDASICSNDTFLLSILIDAAEKIDANVIAYNRYHFGHNSPEGCTVFLMLDESHISVHTYSEEGKISVDVFTCNGKKKCEIAAKYILKKLDSKDYSYEVIERFK